MAVKFPLLFFGLSALAAASDLTLVSFNIRNGGRRMDGVYDHPMQMQVLKDLKPDVVALQEVDHFTRRSGNLDVAGDYGRALGMTIHFASALPYGGGGYGGAVLSKLPVVQDESVYLPVKGDEARVCVIRFVSLPDVGVVAIAGVHLDSSEKDDAARQENAKLILARLLHVQGPVIVMGDFNDGPESATLKLFADAGFRRFSPQGDPHSFPADKPTITIDHVLVKDGAQVAIQDLGTKVVPIANASDHRPLESRVRLTKR